MNGVGFMEMILRVKEKISSKEAIKKITSHALYGAHHEEPRPKDNNDVELFFRKKGIDTIALIEDIRHPESRLPYFENLAGAIWNIVGGTDR